MPDARRLRFPAPDRASTKMAEPDDSRPQMPAGGTRPGSVVPAPAQQPHQHPDETTPAMAAMPAIPPVPAVAASVPSGPVVMPHDIPAFLIGRTPLHRSDGMTAGYVPP